LVSQGKFREDLFCRLAMGTIQMPSLNQRKDEIPHIVEQLIEQINLAGA
jgi:DNA-binding NtrC family response regulator